MKNYLKRNWMNKNLKINRISVRSFRGISKEQYLDLSDITILYGENGTGKSSFVNAFEYIFSNDLANLHRDTIDLLNSIIHKDCNEEDMEIELKFKKKKKLKLTEEPPQGSLMETIKNDFFLKNASFILNRKKLLKFISGTQKDRYIALTELCGFDELNKYRNTLNTVNNSVRKSFEKKETELSQKIEELSSLLNSEEILDLNQCIDNLNILLKNNNFEIIDDLTNIKNIHDDFNLNPKKDETAEYINNFKEIYDALNLLGLKSDLENVLKAYEKIASKNLNSSNLLLNSLDFTYKYINSESSSECPICHNKIDSREVLDDINIRLESLRENISDLNIWSNELNEFKEKLNRLIFDLEKLENISLNINNINQDYLILDLSDDKKSIKELINDLDKLKDSKVLLSEITHFDIFEISKKIEPLLNDLEKYQSDKSSINEDLITLNESLNILERIYELKTEAEILNKRFNTTSKTLELYLETKDEFINNVIFEIKEDVKKYYNYIHGNDDINNPDIELTDENKMDVFLDSFGERVDSRSFASEGHLDTLGLCIFLAFNKKYNPMPLIILDDVVATVDSPHKERIGKLLITELRDTQVFITTHSRLWAEQLKHIARTNKISHSIYEIVDWNLKEGPILAKPLDTEDKIKKYLSNEHLDLNAAGNAARRYLEYNLKEICKLNRVKVPIEDRYAVGTLFDNSKNKILDLVENTDFEEYYQDIYEKNDETKHVANLLSHDNDEFYELSRNDVQSFCDSVLDFRKAFTCTECGKGLLKFDSDSKKLICENPKCRVTVDMIFKKPIGEDDD